MKWQDVKKYLIGSSVGIVVLFSALFLLTGFDYTYSGDIVCGETCESYINVTTTYWRICFDSYNGTKYEEETLFKKQTRSRTLHVNLDKIDNIIKTEPEVPVDWLVPTYGNKWRPIKGGDCWERRKVNKIKLVGHKEPSQTVKWSFDLGDKVNIDPIWEGESNIVYTPSTDRICRDGKCNLVLYSGIRNVYEDNQWKRVEDAQSLKNSGIECVVDSDEEYIAECLDYNYTTKKIKFKINNMENINKDIPIINYKIKYNELIGEKIKEKTKEIKIKFKDLDEEQILWIESDFGDIIHFGEDSTTIQLQDADTENMEDMSVGEDIDRGTTSFFYLSDVASSLHRVYIKFNITSIPAEMTIDSAIIYLYEYEVIFEGGFTVVSHHVYDDTWDGHDETDMTWANQVCGTNFDDSTDCNLTIEDTTAVGITPGWYSWSVVNMFNTEYDNNNKNLTIVLRTTTEGSDNDYIGFRSKEYATTSLRPYLNITYSEPVTECSPTLNQDWEISDNQVCDNTEVTTGTGGIVLIDGGNLTLINNANVTTSGINITDSGGIISVYPGSELRKI